MSLVASKSLNAVSVTGAGTVVEAEQARFWSLQIVVTGSPDQATTVIELSQDNVNFVTDAAAQVSGQMVKSSNAAQFSRANLTTFSGGTTPTVTAWLSPIHE